MSNLPREPEFEQALNELTMSLEPFLAANPEYKKALEVVQVPERIVQFRVVWEDDQGRSQVNRGFRVQVSTMSQASPLLRVLTWPLPVQLGSRSLQGWSPTSPFGQPLNPQVLGLRANVQERPHRSFHGWWKGWF